MTTAMLQGEGEERHDVLPRIAPDLADRGVALAPARRGRRGRTLSGISPEYEVRSMTQYTRGALRAGVYYRASALSVNIPLRMVQLRVDVYCRCDIGRRSAVRRRAVR
jgi:hypothetical protein